MITTLAVFGMGGWEMVLIFAVILVLFGAKRLPELAKGLGHGIKEFKKATRDVTDEIQRSMDDDQYHQPPPRKQIEYTEEHTGEHKPEADAAAPATTVAHTESTPGTVSHNSTDHKA